MIPNRLEGLKEEKNLKSKDIAKNFGVAPSTYSEWEHNKIPIPTKRIIELANYYEVNIDYMLNLSNKRKKIISNNLDYQLIGKRIKSVRDSLGMNLRDFGKYLNYSYSSLASYERGEHLIQSEPLISLCKTNHISIDWLLGRTNQKDL